MSYLSEKQFILSCLQSIHSEQAGCDCDTRISNNLNWDAILSIAKNAKVAPCFFNQLNSLGLAERIPSSIHREFQKNYHKIGYQNVRIFEQLEHVIQLFGKAHLDVIALKGSALLAEVWQNFSLREMADIDLLVHAKDLDLAEDLLRKNDYQAIEYVKPAQHYREHHHHLVPFINLDAAYWIPVEIHHNIHQPANPNPVDMADFWKSSRTIGLQGSEIKVLSPENMLVHLCLHATYSNHILGDIRSLLDISQVVSYFESTIRWTRIVDQAQSAGMANYLFYALYFSKTLMCAPIPRKELNQIRRNVSVDPFSHYLLCLLVRKYCILSLSPPPLIPVYKLQFLCSDIINDVGIAEKLRTIRYKFFFPEKVDGSGKKEKIYQRIAFLGRHLFNNLRSKVEF